MIDKFLLPLLLSKFTYLHLTNNQNKEKPITHGNINAQNRPTLKSSRLLATQYWRKINILFDTTLLTDPSIENEVYVKNTILRSLKSILESIIYVRGSRTIEPFDDTICREFLTVPNVYKENSTEADLIIFVDIVERSDSILATAAPCVVEQEIHRPVVGTISINRRALKISQTDLRAITNIMIHEVLHIFAVITFLYDLYNTEHHVYFRERNRVTESNEFVYKLVTPKLLKAAKEHFGCDSLSGVYMEDGGTGASAGSHFEKIYFGNEIITARFSGYTPLSKMTLALLEDTGWYKVDYGKAQYLGFGRNAGCSIFDNLCPTSLGEYCSETNTTGCTRDYLGKSRCRKDAFTNGCYIQDYVQEYMCTNKHNFQSTARHEQNGNYSRCFLLNTNNKNQSGCYKSTCEAGKIMIEIDNEVFECSTSNQIVKAKGVEIICPDITDFCGLLAEACPDDCNGRGICLVDKTCRCDYLFTGASCNITQGCHKDDDLICKYLLNNTSDFVLGSIEMLLSNALWLILWVAIIINY